MDAPMQNQKHMSTGRTTKEKRDISVMNTNNSCIVSKRSVEKVYHKDENGFLRHFVKKFQRRSPLINRGYWLRMHVVERAIRTFLEDTTTKRKTIVNLGCGYDTVAFKFLAKESVLCRDANFLDVDYFQLLQNKCEIIQKTRSLLDVLSSATTSHVEPNVLLDSQQYSAVACDLQKPKDLDVLKRLLEGDERRMFFLAEVSTTYMDAATTNNLIKWASDFPHAQYCLLEQYLPSGPDDPFAKTMLAHFDKLQSPLKSVVQYPSFWSQHARFGDHGWQTVCTRSLWQMWTDDEVVPLDLKRNLDLIEPFDEWEEFCLFASHYFVLLATNASVDFSLSTRYLSALRQPASPQPRVPHEDDIARLTPSPTTIGVTHEPRRYGAALASTSSTIWHQGGQGAQGRLSSTDVLVKGASKADCREFGPKQEMACHTITTIASGEHVLVGGRTSPNHALRSCYIRKAGPWRQTWNLPCGRYRHSALACGSGLLILGGKINSATIADDWLYFDTLSGWSKIVIQDEYIPRPRFGGCATAYYDTAWPHVFGLMLGGMDADGHVLDDVWALSTVEDNDVGQPILHCVQINHHLSLQATDRFGAKLIQTCGGLILAGGVTGAGVVRTQDEMLSLEIHHHDTSMTTSRMDVTQTESRRRSMLIGHQLQVVNGGATFLVLGGGAVCFSFGTFWNRAAAIYDVNAVARDIPSPAHSLPDASIVAGAAIEDHVPNTNANGVSSGYPQAMNISTSHLKSDHNFEDIVNARTPVMIKELNLGSCVDKWDEAYLKSAVGTETELVIHASSSPSMNFVKKNFRYIKKPFGQFLDDIGRASKEYLRATATHDPTKKVTRLADDFPELAKDFTLPPELAFVAEREHSSPLRISGPVAMWLHYDVMSNILCQIRGSKRLLLYPPGDASKLGYQPGASSSEINAFDPSATTTNHDLRYAQAYEAMLRPGDVLYIPAFWSHTAAPTDNLSVAVNVFFRDLNHGYAAGKDVYGNRDLQAYENGRRDVQRIIKSFKDLPDQARDFYLQRLAMELLEDVQRIRKS